MIKLLSCIVGMDFIILKEKCEKEVLDRKIDFINV